MITHQDVFKCGVESACISIRTLFQAHMDIHKKYPSYMECLEYVEKVEELSVIKNELISTDHNNFSKI